MDGAPAPPRRMSSKNGGPAPPPGPPPPRSGGEAGGVGSKELQLGVERSGTPGKKARRPTMARGNLPRSLPVRDHIQLKVSSADKKQKYRRGSVIDRYRRASVFNEIMEENKKAAEKAGKTHNKRLDAIQRSKKYGLDTAHRSRLMAFEAVAHSEGVEDGDFVINPFCVAVLPEPIRLAFVTKVFGILLTQMLLMLSIICLMKYTVIGPFLVENYSLWMVLLCFVPLIFLAVLMGVRKKHPWNLVAFCFFTLSWGYCLGIVCVFLNTRLFIATTGMVAANTLAIMALARVVSYDRFNCATCSALIITLSIVSGLVSYGIYPDEAWGAHFWPAFITIIFGAWMAWDIKALQIDLTADEYIIGAVDLYLDIINMFLWLLICCLHCFETVLK